MRTAFCGFVFFCLCGLAWGMTNDTSRLPSDLAPLDPAHPWQLHTYRTYGFGISHTPMPSPTELAAMGVNLIPARGGGFNFGTPKERTANNETRVQKDIATLHGLGIKAVAGAVMVAIHLSPEHPLPPEFLQHCVRDEHGKPYPTATPTGKKKTVGGDSGSELWLCVRDPFWQERFSLALLEQAKLGFDMTHIDQGHAAVCFCDICRRAWADFSRQQLGRAVSLEEANKSQDLAVTANYAAFRYEGVINYVRQAHRRIDAVRPGYGIDTTDHIEDRSLYFWTHGRDAFDMAAIEENSVPADWFVPDGEGLTGYRMALACLGPNHTAWTVSKHTVPADKAVAPGVTEEDASTAESHVSQPVGDRWQRLNPSPDRQRLYMAQGLAEGVMINPQTLADHHAKNWGTKRIPYDDLIGTYYRFQKAHEADFRRSHSMAHVAVLVSVADAVFQRKEWAARLYGVCETLLKTHIPYDVRVLEYPNEIEATRYQAFLIPTGTCLSDAALDFLAAAATARKPLLTFGPLGQRTENFIVRQKPLPTVLTSLKPLPIKTEDLLFPFNEDRQLPGAIELAGRVCAAAGQPLQVKHSNAARLVITPLQADSGAILHILNYNIPTFPQLSERQQLAKEQVVPADNVALTVQMPSSARATTVSAESPDHAAMPLSFEQKDDQVSIKIPRVGVWEVIFIKTH